MSQKVFWTLERRASLPWALKANTRRNPSCSPAARRRRRIGEPGQRATKCDGLYPRRTLVRRVARGPGISAPRPEIPARSWRTAGSPYCFSAPGWGKCSRTPASRNTGGAPGGFYDQARAGRLERRDFAQRSTYFEVKAGRGGKRARRRVDRYLRKLQI